MKGPNDARNDIEKRFSDLTRRRRKAIDDGLSDIWGKDSDGQQVDGGFASLQARMKAFDARMKQRLERHARWAEQAHQDVWQAGTSRATDALAPPFARPWAPGPSPVAARIDLGQEPALEIIDQVFCQDFALRQHLDADLTYPTIYCETLEEFFAPWVEMLDISASARRAHLSELVSQAEEDSQAGKGLWGVNFPGRGCYLNGWLFAYTRNPPSPSAALRDPAILPSIMGTAAHEKLGHGFIALFTETGREKQQLDLWRYDLAQRFGQQLSDSPESALLARKHGALWYRSRYLEEGWATWIEHYMRSRISYANEGRPVGRAESTQPYTLTQVWHAIDQLRNLDLSSEVAGALQALATALDLLYCSESVDGRQVHRAVLTLQAVEQTLAEPMGRMLGQPLPYVLGYLTMRRIEAQQGTFCAPYAVVIAGNVTFDIEHIPVADLERVVREEARLNLDARLFLLSTLSLDEQGSLRELAHRAREQLSLTVPQSLAR